MLFEIHSSMIHIIYHGKELLKEVLAYIRETVNKVTFAGLNDINVYSYYTLLVFSLCFIGMQVLSIFICV